MNTNNYMSTYTQVYIQLYEYVVFLIYRMRYRYITKTHISVSTFYLIIN